MESGQEGFYHLGLASDILAVLERLKFKTPTAIQHQAIPEALEGKDVLGVAQTGTGKTMAFGIPMIQRLAADGGQALVLVPTRELAIQVSEALEPLLAAFKMKSAVLIGGIKIYEQMPDLRRGPDVIIATPGRMNDHIYRGSMDLGDIVMVVLDEADRMLDMGFEPQVSSIMRCVPPKRQTLLFSATMPSEILKLVNKYMHLPITIEIAPSGTTVKDITQELFIVRESRKKEMLELLLKQYRGTVLVFTRTKMKAARVARHLKSLGVRVSEIHSDRSMAQRGRAIEGFKRGRYRVLVATDIAARGIDVSMIELVVNYDLPDDAQDYVHRIGRTGRAGQTGHAISFATPTQSRDVKKIEDLIRMTLPRGQQESLAETEFEQGSSDDRGRRRRFPRRPRRDSGAKTVTDLAGLSAEARGKKSPRARRGQAQAAKKGPGGNRARRSAPRQSSMPVGSGKPGSAQRRGPREKV